jgi:hypothetical protein
MGMPCRTKSTLPRRLLPPDQEYWAFVISSGCSTLSLLPARKPTIGVIDVMKCNRKHASVRYAFGSTSRASSMTAGRINCKNLRMGLIHRAGFPDNWFSHFFGGLCYFCYVSRAAGLWVSHNSCALVTDSQSAALLCKNRVA